MLKRQEYNVLDQENNRLKNKINDITGQLERMQEPEAVDVEDLHQLDIESAMEAIRQNGYEPELHDSIISFDVQDGTFILDVSHFPYVILARHYDFDPKLWNMDLLHAAADKVMNELFMAKIILYTEDDEDNAICFQVQAVENKYGHFKDCLPHYITIIAEAEVGLLRIHKKMENNKNKMSLISQYFAPRASEKQIPS